MAHAGSASGYCQANLAWELHEETQWAEELHQDRMDARHRPRLSRMEWWAQRELTGRVTGRVPLW